MTQTTEQTIDYTVQDLTMASIVEWFKLAVPTPTPDNYRVQLGCHLEEVGEMLEKVFDLHDPLTIKVNEEADRLKSGKS